MRTVGIDYLSVGGCHSDGAKIHKILLQAGIWIIEELDLSPVAEGLTTTSPWESPGTTTSSGPWQTATPTAFAS